jgi:UDP-glucose 4-epimerase
MPRALVTGGAGFIGSHLIDALLARGDQVRVIDNLSTGRMENVGHVRNDIEFIEADVTDGPVLARAVTGVDCIYHQAAIASVPRSVAKPLESHAAGATATLMVLDAARKAKVRRVVFASTSAAYGDSPSPSKKETDLPVPISPYGATKVAGELYCNAFAAISPVETVSLRYFNVFGPRQDPNGEYSAVIPKFITMLLSGKPPVVFGDGKQSRDFVFVGDVAQANLLASQAEGVSGKVFNVASGQPTTLLDLIANLNELLGTKIKPKFDPPRAGDVKESLADISAAKKLLGYKPKINFEEGLRQSIDYYRSALGK